jgi:crotonobetainyl-CoA:carnitine CoA-transferase CaiB-like acyl-CoA transferase
VVDLSALWAGPLCGQLLRASGARVIKLESSSRPDATRSASARFFERLNAGKKFMTLDFSIAAGRDTLRALLERADIVITSARPRALHQLGIAPERMLAAQPEKIWVAITAFGWEGAAGQRIGFGDDAAAAAGLIALSRDGQPWFIGDAIADPLAGLAASSAALNAWQQQRGGLLDISLAQSAARVVSRMPLPSAFQ